MVAFSGNRERCDVALERVGVDEQSPASRLPAGGVCESRSVMDTEEIVVVVGAVVLIVLVLWYFYGGRSTTP